MTIKDIETMQEKYRDQYIPKLDFSNPVFYIALGVVVFVAMNIISKKRKR